MARTRTTFRCMQCGHDQPKWVGRCPACEAWNSLVEEVAPLRHAMIPPPGSGAALSIGYGATGSGTAAPGAGTPGATVHGATGPTTGVAAVPITQVHGDVAIPMPTGIDEVDRVLGGGLVPGSVTLLGGEPGVGKSTLVLQILAQRARHMAPVLYVTGEESAGQVRLRAERLGALEEGITVVSATSLSDIVAVIVQHRPEIVVIDSIQTVFAEDVASAPGSVTQVRECAFRLVQLAKATTTTIVLVGHVTKEGNLAGPRVLEHVVDTVLSFDGDRHNVLRTLRAHKHRFGSTEELGVFAMDGSGLRQVPDPSGVFLGDRRPGVAGSSVTCTLQGHRPLLVEIQTLFSPSVVPNARRSAQGMDGGRLSLLLAVLDSRLGLGTHGVDVYANAVGGIRITEPGADLAIALSLISSARDTAIDGSLIACGEVGLGGEIRGTERLERRLSEAARHGFTKALVPASAPEITAPIEVVRVSTLDEAARRVGLA